MVEEIYSSFIEALLDILLKNGYFNAVAYISAWGMEIVGNPSSPVVCDLQLQKHGIVLVPALALEHVELFVFNVLYGRGVRFPSVYIERWCSASDAAPRISTELLFIRVLFSRRVQ